MNLLILVGPRLDNICQIWRKWYYSSGWKNFQSKRGWSRKCIRWLLEKKLMNLGYARGVQICCFWLYHLQSPDVLLLSYALYVNRSCWGRRPGHFDASDSCEASLKSTMLIRAVFSWPELESDETMSDTVAHCSILFLFDKNCLNID
jgi:hypothetical protein